MDDSVSDEELVGAGRPFDIWATLQLNESLEPKVVVPWVHRFELIVVAEDIYSSQLERQKRGYGKLLMWKARFPQIPIGVECTMGLLRVLLVHKEVCLQEQKGETSIYSEYDLRLMLSSSITRSINQLQSASHEKTISSLQVKLNIPRWVVTLRHEASHRSVLPSVSKSILGVQFLLEWLYTHYWEPTKSCSGWIISKSNHSLISNPNLKTSFKEIFDAWQSAKMFQVAGYEDLSECDKSGTIDKTIRRKLDEELETKSVCEAVSCLSERLIFALKELCGTGGPCHLKTLYSILLESDTFIPNEEVLNLAISYQKGKALKIPSKEEEKHSAIIEWMMNFWSDLLKILQEEYSFFPGLIHKLLVLLGSEKSSHRQLIIALWIKVICGSMDLSSQYFAYVKFSKQRRSLENKRLKQTKQERFRQVERFLCMSKNTVANYCTVDVLKYALLHPTEYTSLFLRNLLEVTRPVIPRDLKKQLIELVSLYLGKNLLEERIPVSHHIYTVSELSGKSENYEMEHLSLSFWERASAQEWEECPLGVLPWQKGKLTTLDFPPQVTWESTGENHFNHSEFNDFNLRKDLDEEEMDLIDQSIEWWDEGHKRKIPQW